MLALYVAPTQGLVPAWPASQPSSVRVRMSFVNDTTGAVESRQLPILSKWSRNESLQGLLQAIREEMKSSQNRKLAQPQETAPDFPCGQ